MPRDGSGNYQLPSGQPVVTSTPISSTVHNSFASDVAIALTNSLTKDGQTTPTANLPMGGNKHTNVSDGTARNQYGSIGQIQDGTLYAVGSVTGVDAISGSLTPAITGYVNGMIIVMSPAGTNTTTTPTLSLNGLAAKNIVKFGNSAMAAGDLSAGDPAVLTYASNGGGRWVMLNPNVVPGQLLVSGSVSLAKLADMPADTIIARGSGVGVGVYSTCTSAGRSLIDDPDAASQRATLGLGTLATQSGTFSGTFSGSHSGTSSGTNTGDQTSVTGSAGTLQGYAPASAATVNTVAVRDGSGYLFAGYFNGAEIPENATISSLVFKNGSDGYHRTITFANAMTQINASVSIAASQVASGTIANARLPNIGSMPGVTIASDPGGTPSGSAGQMFLYY